MSELYKISVLLAAENRLGPVLSALAGQFVGLHKDVAKLEKQFGGLTRAKLAFFGGAGIIAGGGIIKGLLDVAKHGDEILDQQSKMIRAGRTHAEVARLTADAYAKITKAVPTAAAADVLRATNQIAAVTGDTRSAEKWAPFALKTEALIANLTGARAEGAGHDILRALEMRGLTAGSAADRAIGQKLAEAMVGDIGASGGKLTSKDFQTMAKRGGAFYSHLSPEFIAGAGAVLAADLGGDTAGTTIATTGMFLSGAGTMSKQQYQALRDAHMIDQSKVSIDKGGRVNARAGAIIGSGLAMTDPFQWVQRVLLPHLHGQGLKDGSPEMEAALSKIGRNRNTIRELTMFSSPEFVAQIHKDIELFRKALGLDRAYDDYVKRDPKGVEAAYDAQYKSMMGAIGAPLMQAAIPVMRGITSMFNSIAEFAAAHPGAIQAIGAGFAGLGAALIGAGGIALVAALGSATAGVVALTAGVSALGAAFVLYKPGALKEFAAGFKEAWSGIAAGDWRKAWAGVQKEWRGTIDAFPAAVKGGIVALDLQIRSWPVQLAGAIETMGAGLVKMIGDKLSSLFSGGGQLGKGDGDMFPQNQSLRGGAGGGRLWNAMWNGSMMPVGSGTGPGHTASQSDRAAFIRSYAASIGIDPNTALRVSQSEGFYRYTGDQGRSFGDFQMFTGGGVGNRALAAGINVRDPNQWRAADKFALDVARREGWSQWHGAAKVGIGNHQGIGVRPAAPVHVHTNVHLDGKVMARVVTKHQVAALRQPNGIGAFDDHSMRMAGGATMFAA